MIRNRTNSMFAKNGTLLIAYFYDVILVELAMNFGTQLKYSRVQISALQMHSEQMSWPVIPTDS